MRCYICGNRTEVAKTMDRDDGGKVVRKRRCVVHNDHVMETMEQFLPPSLDDVGVRQSGSGQLSRERFSRERLERDVAQSILRGVGRDKEPHALAERVALNVIRRLESQLIQLASPVTSAERQHHPGMKVAISDSAIANAVEAELRHMALRMPRALYALSIRGRQDREGRDGWSTAEDALNWIYDNYPKLTRSAPLAPPTPPTFTWSPSRRATRPHWVIKRSRPRPARFEEAQFVGSIRRAMLGRKEADLRSRLLAEWVLHGIEGQQTVLSSQLGVGVLDALRRVDDIAYLRWTTIFKGLTGVTELAEEAYALVESPSARLAFESSPMVPIDRGSALI